MRILTMIFLFGLLCSFTYSIKKTMQDKLTENQKDQLGCSLMCLKIKKECYRGDCKNEKDLCIKSCQIEFGYRIYDDKDTQICAAACRATAYRCKSNCHPKKQYCRVDCFKTRTSCILPCGAKMEAMEAAKSKVEKDIKKEAKSQVKTE
jgi:hypothetical protein